MPVTQANPVQDIQIDRPSCPRCFTHMWLARISPSVNGQEWRTFECPVCDAPRDKIDDRSASGSRIDF